MDSRLPAAGANKGFFRDVNKFDCLSDAERSRLARRYVDFETEIQDIDRAHVEIMELLNSNTVLSLKLFVLKASSGRSGRKT
jgi:hypothetical protein